MVIGGFLVGVAWDAFLTFFCPVLASCSARDLLLSHRLETCVAYHPLRLRLDRYIFLLLLPVAINPRKAYSTDVHRFRHDPGCFAQRWKCIQRKKIEPPFAPRAIFDPLKMNGTTRIWENACPTMSYSVLCCFLNARQRIELSHCKERV